MVIIRTLTRSLSASKHEISRIIRLLILINKHWNIYTFSDREICKYQCKIWFEYSVLFSVLFFWISLTSKFLGLSGESRLRSADNISHSQHLEAQCLVMPHYRLNQKAMTAGRILCVNWDSSDLPLWGRESNWNLVKIKIKSNSMSNTNLESPEASHLKYQKTNM